MQTDLEVRIVTDSRSFQQLEPEWDRLVRTTRNELPFLQHRWLYAWWAHYRQQRALIQDTLFLMTVRARGNLVGIIPLMRTVRPGRGPVAFRSLTFLGADAYVTELRRPIVDPAHESEVATAVCRTLRATKGWDWIQWPGLVRGGPFAAAMENETGVAWLEELPAYELELAGTWDEFKSGLKRNIKESLRRCYNAPKRDGHEIRVEVARAPNEIRPALERFAVLHSMRADVADAVAHPDRFATPRARGFLFDVCDRLAEVDMTRVFTLFVNDQAVACRIGFMLPETLYLYFSGYDPAWAKYSVMTTTVAEAIKYAIESKLRRVHLSTGTDVSKTRWGATETVFADALAVRPSLRSKLARRSWELAEQTRDDPRFASLTRRFRRA